MTPATGNIATQANANWPQTNTANTNLNLASSPVGCVNNSNGGSTGYFFYQVLYVQ